MIKMKRIINISNNKTLKLTNLNDPPKMVHRSTLNHGYHLEVYTSMGQTGYVMIPN